MTLDDTVWGFITANQVIEIFPYIIDRYKEAIANRDVSPEAYKKFDRSFIQYLDALEEGNKKKLIYSAINEATTNMLTSKLCDMVEELNLMDFDFVKSTLEQDNFTRSKVGIKLLTYDKSFYCKKDIDDFKLLLEIINNKFIERGERGSKKGLLSSKEKEIWNCECGKVNILIGENCGDCMRDISGFLPSEIKPTEIAVLVAEKIEFIEECVV